MKTWASVPNEVRTQIYELLDEEAKKATARSIGFSDEESNREEAGEDYFDIRLAKGLLLARDFLKQKVG